jgi:hypothetical protein
MRHNLISGSHNKAISCKVTIPITAFNNLETRLNKDGIPTLVKYMMLCGIHTKYFSR